jgi:hypothetical protein
LKLPVLVQIIALSAVVIAPIAVADESPRTAPATIDDFAWLTGHWVGGEDGEVIAETWGAPHDGLILGMFRQDSPRQTFYELFTLAVTEDGVELRIRHFNVGLVAWEEKDETVLFRLTSWQPSRAAFVDQEGARLIYEREGDELVAALEKDRDGKTRRFEFRYRRSPL